MMDKGLRQGRSLFLPAGLDGGFAGRALDARNQLGQRLPKVAIPGHRKLFVRRTDVELLLEACTFGEHDVRPT